MRSILTLLLLLALTGPAFASDGVLEINQTCATQTGCFPGDAAGFPVSITASGSYILTSNLTGIAVDIDGIFINSALITIDFNGFSLISGAFGTGTGNGITGLGVDGQFVSFLTTKNGLIRGFGGIGIALGLAKGVRIENMIFDTNAGGGAHVGAEAQILRSGFSSNGGRSISAGGLSLGTGALIEGNVVSGSGSNGIVSGTGSTVSGNTAYLNGLNGILVGPGSTVSRNTVYQNELDGIDAGDGSTVSGNSAYDNQRAGIVLGQGSRASRNTAYQNANGIVGVNGLLVSGNSAHENQGAGIVVGSGSLVQGNTLGGNNQGGSGCSLSMNPDGVYRDNVITTAPLPAGQCPVAVGGASNGGENFCDGVICP